MFLFLTVGCMLEELQNVFSDLCMYVCVLAATQLFYNVEYPFSDNSIILI